MVHVTAGMQCRLLPFLVVHSRIQIRAVLATGVICPIRGGDTPVTKTCVGGTNIPGLAEGAEELA
jgi:hypothetical protein